MPEESLLHSDIGPGDFTDGYSVWVNPPVRAAAEEVGRFPAWAAVLLKPRNLIVRPFGPETEPRGSGDQIGIFPVLHQSETELIAGLDDKHLNFKISVFCDGKQTHLSTWVQPHNRGGRLYLVLVMPFHVLIVRHAAARLLRLKPGARH